MNLIIKRHTPEVMEAILNIRFVAALLYLSAAIAYIVLLRSGKRRSTLSTTLLGVGLALHGIEIIVRGAEAGGAGGAPFASLSGFISIFAFVLGLTYFVLERMYRQYRISSLGAFHVPVLFVLHLWSVFLKQPMLSIPRINTGPLFVIHAMSSICAYAALTAGFVAGVAFLLLDRQLRSKKFDVFMRGLPNLDLVERVNASAVRLGFLLLVVAGIIGLVMGYLEWGWAYEWDVKVWMTAFVALIFGAQLALRRFAGWAGRRAVIVSVIGFVAIVINATVMNFFFSKLHGVM